jgi:hypothetical protein
MTYLEKLNEEIATTKTEKSRLLQLCVELEGIENRLPSKQRDLAKAAKLLEKELKDVENLKGLSFVALWQTLIGNRKEKLSKEEEEYLAAKLEYEELKEELEIMTNRKIALSTVVVEYEQIKKKVERLLKNKEHFLISMEISVSSTLEQLGNFVENKSAVVNELEVVIELGEQLNRTMLKMFSLIDKVPSQYLNIYDHALKAHRRTPNYHYAAAITRIQCTLPKLQYQLNNYADQIRKIEAKVKTTKRINVKHFEMYSTYVTRDIGAALKKTKGVKEVITKTQQLLREYHVNESGILRRLERERIDLMDKF